MTTTLVRSAIPAAVLAVLAGCATVPTGPAWQALPGSRTTADQYARDDADCRAYAQAHFAPASAQAANEAAASNVVGGTLLGAAIGALFGAAVGDAGGGAAIGAGMGMLGGGAVAADMSGASSAQLQAIYDRAYLDCMYARGHRVPGPVAAYRRPPPGYPVPNAAPPAAGYPPRGTAPPRGYAPPTAVPPPGGYPPADAPPPPR